MNNGRDCVHGRLARSCEICELTTQLAAEKAAHAETRKELRRSAQMVYRLDEDMKKWRDVAHDAPLDPTSPDYDAWCDRVETLEMARRG